MPTPSEKTIARKEKALALELASYGTSLVRKDEGNPRKIVVICTNPDCPNKGTEKAHRTIWLHHLRRWDGRAPCKDCAYARKSATSSVTLKIFWANLKR